VIYENYASSLSGTTFDSWVTCAPSASAKAGYKYKFSGIAHTAALADMPTLISEFSSLGIGQVYVTGVYTSTHISHLHSYSLSSPSPLYTSSFFHAQISSHIISQNYPLDSSVCLLCFHRTFENVTNNVDYYKINYRIQLEIYPSDVEYYTR
jgi:hypothetical protein